MIKTSKKGFSLIEVIVSIAIILMIVVASVSAIIISQKSVFSDTKREDASMEAQSIADELMVQMAGKAFGQNENNVQVGGPLNVVDSAVYSYVASITDVPQNKSNCKKQFTIIKYKQTVNSVMVSGTKIMVAVYYNDTEYILVEAFAPEIVAE